MIYLTTIEMGQSPLQVDNLLSTSASPLSSPGQSNESRATESSTADQQPTPKRGKSSFGAQ